LNGRPLAILGLDGRLLFLTRMVRVFAYGSLSVVLVLYLAALGIDDVHIGAILTLTLVGDAAISLWLTTRADAVGRRLVLQVGSALMLVAGVAFVLSNDFWVLVVAGTVGVISVSGGEVGPFQAIEQAALSHILPDNERTRIFGWYSLAGSFAAALGALTAGLVVQGLQLSGASILDSYRAVIVGYAIVGIFLLVAFSNLTPAIEVRAGSRSTVAGRLGLHRSRRIVFPPVRAVRAGFLRRRPREPEPGRVLVHPPFRRPAGDPRRHLLCREHPCRPIRPRRRSAGGPIRARPDDGLHPSALERPPADPASDAEPEPGGVRPAGALQP